ncbi:MAG: response regulator transcription factor [Bacteroidetes bacterium]|nr:response regulator transcription factor [Bacteroidota bacterium]
MNIYTTTNFRILIVEDEILIADTIKRYLRSAGHAVVGNAISYEEGVEMIHKQRPDLVLLDIRLNGPKTGIDLARYIQKSKINCPYIFLTAQSDAKNIMQAKETLPGGYLTKPLQKESLIASIEIVMHRFFSQDENKKSVLLNDGSQKIRVETNNILFLQSEHVYVRVFLEGEESILQRSSMKELMDQLPADIFLQTHRSFIINVNKVKNWKTESLFIGQQEIPVSRGRRKDVFEVLAGNS